MHSPLMNTLFIIICSIQLFYIYPFPSPSISLSFTVKLDNKSLYLRNFHLGFTSFAVQFFKIFMFSHEGINKVFKKATTDAFSDSLDNISAI